MSERTDKETTTGVVDSLAIKQKETISMQLQKSICQIKGNYIFIKSKKDDNSQNNKKLKNQIKNISPNKYLFILFFFFIYSSFNFIIIKSYSSFLLLYIISSVFIIIFILLSFIII